VSARHAALLVALFTCFAATAAPTVQQRRQTFARLPDWTGIWIADDGVMTRLGLRNDVEGDAGPTFKDLILRKHPPYNAEWEARYQAARKAAGSPAAKECGFYFPGVMESPWPFEMLITPEETAIIFAGREVRHIYTDQRSHPSADDIWPTPWGDSIGRWEGQTLVAETISVASKGPGAMMLSPSAKFVERIRRMSRDKIDDQLTIEDPVSLTHPWVLTISYKRVTNIDRVIHSDCMENDRNPVVNGAVTIEPPKR
jgi:hypothetical protein